MLLLPTAALADPAHEHAIEAGGFVGGASTNVSTTGPCPVLFFAPAAPADECQSNPHQGARGAVIGAHARFGVLRQLKVEVDLAYAQKGYNAGNPVRLHYLEAPIVVRFEPLAGVTAARASVFAGVAPAILVACRMSGQIFINEYPPHAEMYDGPCAGAPGGPTPSRLDLSGVLGVGLGWQFGPFGVEVQARFVRGLIDMDAFGDPGKTVNDARYVLIGFDRKL
jgi:hypothetical protein